jgi:iron complex outermembrane receptor protein
MRNLDRTNDHGRAQWQASSLLALTLASVLQVSSAAEPSMRFDQPAQPLAAALQAIAKASGLKLLYADAAVQGRQAAPLRGNYTTKEALQTVLADSGLSYEFVGENMVAVKDSPAEDAEDTKRTALPEMTVTAKPWDATSYSVPNATTATKTDTPILETPVSIQVVPQQVLKDQQAINLQDALKNVSGVVPDFGFSYRERFTIRGFQTNQSNYRDGFRSTETRLPLAIAERIEVVRRRLDAVRAYSTRRPDQCGHQTATG